MTAAVPRFVPGADAWRWLGESRDVLRERLVQFGAIHLVAFGVRTAADVDSVREVLGLAPAVAREHFTARRRLTGAVWGPADWGADREMCLHHEQAHAVQFPGTVLVGVIRPPATGGAVLLCDTRRLLGRLPIETVEGFRRAGWLLVRNFRPYFGASWAEVFDARTPAAVEAYCDENAIGWRWGRDGTLRTVQRRSAVLRHPVTGDECWFNQIAFLSRWTIDEDERQTLLSTFGPDGMPFDTGYGDGRPLTEESFIQILAAYDDLTVRIDCGAGDLLVIDNVLMAQGRMRHSGDREIAVALAEPMMVGECSPTVTASAQVGRGSESTSGKGSR